jgi:hypothetical protein
MGVLAIGYDFGSALFLINRTHGPTCLGGIIRNAGNMPEFVLHFGTTVTWQKSRPIGGGGVTFSTYGEDSSTMVGKDVA